MRRVVLPFAAAGRVADSLDVEGDAHVGARVVGRQGVTCGGSGFDDFPNALPRLSEGGESFNIGFAFFGHSQWLRSVWRASARAVRATARVRAGSRGSGGDATHIGATAVRALVAGRDESWR